MRRQMQLARWALAILLVLSALGVATVQAQEYPNKPINLIIPLGPGGGHDLTARAITPIAQKYLGQPLILQHKPGGGGSIASMQVAKAEPDGYTLLFGGVGPNCALPAIEKGRSAGPDELAAVCMVAGYSGLVVGRAGAPFKTIKQLVAYAKANPGKVVVATSGPWGSTDIGQKKLMLAAGYTARIVPYDGGGPAILAVVGKHADVTSVTPFSGYAHIKAGKMVPLVVMAQTRHPEYPDVPTTIEEGINAVHFPWISVNAPKGTPPAIIKRLAAAFKKMIEDPATVEICRKAGVETKFVDTEEFARDWRKEFEEYKELAKVFKK